MFHECVSFHRTLVKHRLLRNTFFPPFSLPCYWGQSVIQNRCLWARKQPNIQNSPWQGKPGSITLCQLAGLHSSGCPMGSWRPDRFLPWEPETQVFMSLPLLARQRNSQLEIWPLWTILSQSDTVKRISVPKTLSSQQVAVVVLGRWVWEPQETIYSHPVCFISRPSVFK